jgi:hypothetical protein
LGFLLPFPAGGGAGMKRYKRETEERSGFADLFRSPARACPSSLFRLTYTRYTHPYKHTDISYLYEHLRKT